MVFVKGISLACFSKKWSSFLWFGCWGNGKSSVPKGDPDCLPLGPKLCLCSLAAHSLGALLFTTSIVQVTEKFSG